MDHSNSRLDRRTALKWMMLATAGGLLGPRWLPGAEPGEPALTPATAPPLTPETGGTGYGTDPDLFKPYAYGDFWSLTFTPAQHRVASALCDVILPADERSPAASVLKVPDFIDEWISAPYVGHPEDRTVILEGLAWLESEAMDRFSAGFTELGEADRRLLCDDICDASVAAEEHKKAAHFFARFRSLTLSGFYTTPEGQKDLQFMGDTPSASFAGPSDEILARLGVLGTPPQP